MLSLLVAASLAAADPPADRLHFEWLAPEGCPSRDALAAALEASVPPNRAFWASVRIDEPRQEGGRWRAVVITTADGNRHTRLVEGPDCQRVTDAAVLVVTLAATTLPPPKDPEEWTSGAATADGAAADASATKSTSTEGAEAGEKSPPSEPFRFTLRAQPLVGGHAGVFPFPGLGWGAALTMVTGRLRAQVALVDWIGFQGPTTRGVRGTLISAALKGCWTFEPHEAVRLGPCTAVEMGRMTVEATGVASPHTANLFWSSVLAGATAGFGLTKSITPWVTAEVGLNLVRPRFIISADEQNMTLHSVGWVLGRVTLGVEFELSVP